MKLRVFLSIILPVLLLSSVHLAAQETALRVVATTTIIADVARNIGGERVEVTALIPFDADAHAFTATPSDVAAVAQADMVLVNGAGLEAFLSGLLENAGDVQPVVVSDGVRVLAFGGHGHDHDDEDHDDHDDEDHDDHDDEHHDDHAEALYIGVLGVDADCGDHHDDEQMDDEHDHGECDPHFWTDPTNVMIWADNIAAAFAVADPENADFYSASAAAYKGTLAELDAQIEALLEGIPHEERVIVTNHEFLAYFAARYDFEIVGVVIPGGTTLAEPSPRELAALIETIRDEGVRAIFAEVSDPGALAGMIAGDIAGVQVVTLYSDSLSGPGGPASSYIDYMLFNAQAIAAALGG